MNTNQVLTVMRDHTAIRQEGVVRCACAPTGLRMVPWEHTAHVAEAIATASQGTPASGPHTELVQAGELGPQHIGYAATLPVQGLGADARGRVLAVGVYASAAGPMVEVALWHEGRTRDYVVKPSTPVELTPDSFL